MSRRHRHAGPGAPREVRGPAGTRHQLLLPVGRRDEEDFAISGYDDDGRIGRCRGRRPGGRSREVTVERPAGQGHGLGPGASPPIREGAEPDGGLPTHAAPGPRVGNKSGQRVDGRRSQSH